MRKVSIYMHSLHSPCGIRSYVATKYVSRPDDSNITCDEAYDPFVHSSTYSEGAEN